jgi:hypothetical protein
MLGLGRGTTMAEFLYSCHSTNLNQLIILPAQYPRSFHISSPTNTQPLGISTNNYRSKEIRHKRPISRLIRIRTTRRITTARRTSRMMPPPAMLTAAVRAPTPRPMVSSGSSQQSRFEATAGRGGKRSRPAASGVPILVKITSTATAMAVVALTIAPAANSALPMLLLMLLLLLLILLILLILLTLLMFL